MPKCHTDTDSDAYADPDPDGRRFSDTNANLHAIVLAKRTADDRGTAQSGHSGSRF